MKLRNTELLTDFLFFFNSECDLNSKCGFERGKKKKERKSFFLPLDFWL